MTGPVKRVLIVLTALAVTAIALLVFAATHAADTLNALASINTRRVDAAVAYGPLERQRLDVYAPTTAAPAAGHPVVVFFYGGSWNRGERADYRFVGEALAARGVLTLLADYRLYPEVRYPDFLSDCALALAYGLREAARLGGNPQRVFVMGHSAAPTTRRCSRSMRSASRPPGIRRTNWRAGSAWPGRTTSCR